MKSYTDIEQSKKLAEILPLESADMCYLKREFNSTYIEIPILKPEGGVEKSLNCWSLAALLQVLPEINGTPLTLEKVKAEDGYEGYYYHIEYENIVLIPYSKNPIDACVNMIIWLKEQKLL